MHRPNSFIRFMLLSFLALTLCPARPAKAASDSARNNLAIWSPTPARQWPSETFPIGNGRLGCMAFGGTRTEQIQFNEDSLWIGDESDTGAYQNFGDIFVKLDHQAPENYRRELDISQALETITYTFQGIRYHREYFASNPAGLIVLRFTADRKAAYNAVISLADAHKAETAVTGNTLTAAGNLAGYKYKESKEPYRIALDYESRVMVLSDGGERSSDGKTITLTDADALTLLVAAGTDFVNQRAKGWKGEHPHKRLVKQLAAAAKTPYKRLLGNHITDYQSLFTRLTLNLGTTDPALAAKPTGERITAYKQGAKDPDLEELQFQYARYLMISSSRPGCLPANLQGLWNNSNNPPWRCDYHTDVNVEMNYWFVDSANLSECFAPLPEWVDSIHPVRQEETRKTFGTRGWLTHAENGPFGGSTWKWSKGDAAWVMQNLWDHYAFNLDKTYLETRAYPLMQDLCEFWVDHLKELPDGKLVSPDGFSPEHGPTEDGVSFDQQLVWNLFDDYLKAARRLGRDDAFREKVAAMQQRLLGPQIGTWGQLQEWMVDRDDPQDTHRHLSHLIAVHPGHQISPRTTPKFAAAAKVSMNARGDGKTGWSKAWKISIWARLHDGDRAYKLLNGFLKNNVYSSLLGFHPPFQIDGNFGYAEGLCEMLLQSHMRSIDLLPALPKAWPTGAIHGVKARGAFVLDIDWRDGKLARAVILSEKGSRCRIYIEAPLTVTCNGQAVPTRRQGNRIGFSTQRGEKYVVRPQE
jgi:alpha-L-fucosidase 2